MAEGQQTVSTMAVPTPVPYQTTPRQLVACDTPTTRTLDGTSRQLHTNHTRPPVHSHQKHHAGQRLAFPISIVAIVPASPYTNQHGNTHQSTTNSHTTTHHHLARIEDTMGTTTHNTCRNSIGTVTCGGQDPSKTPQQTTPDLTRAFAGQSTRLYCFPTSTKFAWRCSKNSMTSSTTFIPLPTNGSTVYHTIVRRRTSRAL